MNRDTLVLMIRVVIIKRIITIIIQIMKKENIPGWKNEMKRPKMNQESWLSFSRLLKAHAPYCTHQVCIIHMFFITYRVIFLKYLYLSIRKKMTMKATNVIEYWLLTCKEIEKRKWHYLHDAPVYFHSLLVLISVKPWASIPATYNILYIQYVQ